MAGAGDNRGWQAHGTPLYTPGGVTACRTSAGTRRKLGASGVPLPRRSAGLWVNVTLMRRGGRCRRMVTGSVVSQSIPAQRVMMLGD